ncbi:hypothetical protein [Kamptonema formosum]|uniref:hypothetical protein n=1 Tax=Kamptonema formosum TaxID=331992 RepID=UPI0003463A0A|nr:hypothetical protein [Oscillatoria sp. PCC 10802]
MVFPPGICIVAHSARGRTLSHPIPHKLGFVAKPNLKNYTGSRIFQRPHPEMTENTRNTKFIYIGFFILD